MPCHRTIGRVRALAGSGFASRAAACMVAPQSNGKGCGQMHARVAKFEGGDPDAIRRSAAESNRLARSGPPRGVPTTGMLLLTDPDNGRACWVTLYETEEDLHTGDGALNERTPPGNGLGQCVSVEMYEVAVNVSS